jgi:hypothetical protein
MVVHQSTGQQTTAIQSSSQPAVERQHYIDALRVISVWLLIIVHAVPIFAPVRAFQITK